MRKSNRRLKSQHLKLSQAGHGKGAAPQAEKTGPRTSPDRNEWMLELCRQLETPLRESSRTSGGKGRRRDVWRNRRDRLQKEGKGILHKKIKMK